MSLRPFSGRLVPVRSGVMVVGVVLTVVTGVDYVLRAMRLRRESRARPAA